MLYLKIYFSIALIITFTLCVKLLLSKNLSDSKESYFKTTMEILGIALSWPFLVLIFTASYLNDHIQEKKSIRISSELRELHKKSRKKSDDLILKNKFNLKLSDLEEMQLAYKSSYETSSKDNPKQIFRLEYINDLISAMVESLNDCTFLMLVLQKNSEARKISRANFKKELGDGSHVSYVRPDTRISVTSNFARSLEKIKHQEDFSRLSQVVLTANDYLGEDWNPLKELPSGFSLEGLILSTNISDELSLFIVTASEGDAFYANAHLLLIASCGKHPAARASPSLPD